MATKIKTTLAFASDCSMTVTDVTGYYDATTNAEGFYTEATALADVPKDSYRVSDVYFYDVLAYNKYMSAPIWKGEDGKDVTEGQIAKTNLGLTDIKPVYSDTFESKTSELKLDGYYTYYRIAIPTQSFYAAESAGTRFIGKTVYYSNGTNIYKVVGGTPQIITLANFLKESLATATVVLNKNSFISICYLNKCFSDAVRKVLDSNTDLNCNKEIAPAVAQLKAKRDLLFMTTHSVRYLQNLCENDEAQRLIETIMACGGVCTETLSSNNNDCGCHG